nr:MAG TPA: hypothetical protein [Caudoviricetes sp.]
MSEDHRVIILYTDSKMTLNLSYFHLHFTCVCHIITRHISHTNITQVLHIYSTSI